MQHTTKTRGEMTLFEHAQAWYALHGIAIPEQHGPNWENAMVMYRDWASLPMSGTKEKNAQAERDLVKKWKS